MKPTRLALLLALAACCSRGFALPDLTVSELTAECVGENKLGISGTVRNDGFTAAGAFKVTIYLTYYDLSYFTLGEISVAGLASGGGAPISATVNMDPFYPDGQCYISAYADVANSVAEQDDSNNTFDSNDIYLPCGPTSYDIEAVEVYFLNNDTGIGQPVLNFTEGANYWGLIRYRVNSAGSFDVPLRLTIDGATICAGTIAAADGNTLKTATCQDPWVATHGLHTLTATVDPQNATTEPNEGNNVVSFTFGVGVDTPSPTPTKSPTPTATPTASPSPTPTLTATPSATPTPTASPSASATPTPSSTPSASPTPVTAATVLGYLLGLTASPDGLDTNGDGAVDAADLLRSEL